MTVNGMLILASIPTVLSYCSIIEAGGGKSFPIVLTGKVNARAP